MKAMRERLKESRDFGWGGIVTHGAAYGQDHAWAYQLEGRMVMWLEGQHLDYVEFGVRADDPTAANPRAVIVTTTHVLLVGVTRNRDNPADASVSEFRFVRRSDLVDLDATPIEGDDMLRTFPWNLTLVLHFEGLEEPVTLPIAPRDDRDWREQSHDLFLKFREDLWGDRVAPNGRA
jgi:hypothetical protein